MSDQNQAPARVKTALDNKKLNMIAKNDQGKNASLTWSLNNNSPTIVVWTNVENDRDNGRLRAAFDIPHFNAFVMDFQRIIRTGKPDQNYVENKTTKWVDKKPDGMRVESTLHYGINEDGVAFMALTAYNRPNIQFLFESNEYHHFHHRSTGQAFTRGEASLLMATSHLGVVSRIMDQLAVRDFVEIKPKQSGGNGGGYQNRNGGGNGGQNGGYQNRSNGGGQGNYQNNRSNQGGGGGSAYNPAQDPDLDPDVMY